MGTLLVKTDMHDFIAEVDKRVAGGGLAVAQIDLDDFASINSDYGHVAGDKVLESWERTLTRSVPDGAVVRRVGGDEYVVALPDHSAESALIVLKEIKDHFGSRFPAEDVPRRCNVSMGIASRPPHASSTPELLQAAYAALARAKREGRGRIAIYVEEKMVLKSNYYTPAALDRLSKLSDHTGRTEASLLREGLDDLFVKYRDLM